MFVSYLAFVTATAAQMAAAPPKPIERETWLSPDDVPIDVLRARKGGVVGYELQVGESGKPTSCQVTQSSGLPSLDQATCSALMERASFQPARNNDGRAIASAYRSKATFEPPVVDAKAHEGPTVIITRLTLGPDGSLLDCAREGDMSEPLQLNECQGILRSPKGAFLREMAPLYGTFRMVTSVTPPSYRRPSASKAWGERLAYRLNEHIIHFALSQTKCHTAKTDGRADLLGDGCGDNPKASPADLRWRQSGNVMRDETAIFAVKR